MAVETKDYETAINFLQSSNSRKCLASSIPAPAESTRQTQSTSELGGLLKKDYEYRKRTGEWRRDYRIFIAGWVQPEGVMILTPAQELDADLLVEISATNERALRDLLLSFPRTKVGYFRCGDKWMFDALREILDGHELPDCGDCCFLGSNEEARISLPFLLPRSNLRMNTKIRGRLSGSTLLSLNSELLLLSVASWNCRNSRLKGQPL